jgi:hypothetical protein
MRNRGVAPERLENTDAALVAAEGLLLAAVTQRSVLTRRMGPQTPMPTSMGRQGGNTLRITSVGVIGLGSTGRTVARRLLDNGFEVTVHDRDAWTVVTMVETGARPARIPAGAAEPADLVFVHVPDEAAAEEVLFDCGGVGETLRDGGFVVAASATGSAFVRAAADRLGALGLRTVEAWFTGEAGSTATTVFIGCSPQDLATVAPALRAVADNVIHIGPLGSVCALRTAVAALGALPPFAPEDGHNAARVDPEEALPGRVGDESSRAAPDGHSVDRRAQSAAALARAFAGALVDGRARPCPRQYEGGVRAGAHGPRPPVVSGDRGAGTAGQPSRAVTSGV